MSTSLRFLGVIAKGAGRFSTELKLPGRSLIPGSHPGWPESVHPGTLNIRITQFPDNFGELGEGSNTGKFDSGNFAPAFTFPADLIAGNTLPPKLENPRRGIGQAWEALLHLPDRHFHECWMIRRVGSQMPNFIELVSSICIRDTYNITIHTEPEVVLDIFEGKSLP